MLHVYTFSVIIPSRESHTCVKCGNNSSFMIIQTGEKPYMCEVWVHYLSFMVISTGGKPFMCEVWVHYLSFMIIQTGEKPFMCEVWAYYLYFIIHTRRCVKCGSFYCLLWLSLLMKSHHVLCQASWLWRACVLCVYTFSVIIPTRESHTCENVYNNHLQNLSTILSPCHTKQCLRFISCGDLLNTYKWCKSQRNINLCNNKLYILIFQALYIQYTFHQTL